MGKRVKNKFVLGSLVGAPLAVVLVLAACAGPADVTGQAGPPGPPGSVYAEYVGSGTCAEADCHADIAEVVQKSGHPYKLTKVVNGQPPEYPFSVVSELPEGYTWDDITYVIGGYNWKARFIDKDGYIITGVDENATTQYNFANPVVGKDAGWVGYHAGEEEKPYDCGSCHTTGYNPEGHQDGLPGLIGTWSEPGVQCESCHGPGGNHVNKPYGVEMKIDRSSEQCGTCHSRGDVTEIDASGGFIRHHEQYEELLQTKHQALSCVTCHDPHQGVIQARETDVETVRVECQSCHFEEAKFQKSEIMKAVVDCIDCHMPRIVKSAWGDADAYTGDIRSHLFAIDPDAASQFSEDGKTAISQVSLDFACKSCHSADGMATVKTDERLYDEAVGYHSDEDVEEHSE